MGNLSLFLQHLTNGISGQFVALIAIGYTMVYGILRADQLRPRRHLHAGRLLTYFGMLYTSIPWWLVFIIAPALTGLDGLLL